MAATLTGFRSYATERGYPAPSLASDADAEAAIVRGTDYVSTEYSGRFLPSCTMDNLNVEMAVYEAALVELSEEGALSPSGFWNRTYGPDKQKVLTEVKGIKWEVVGGSDGRFVPRSSRIDSLLAGCLAPPPLPIGLWAIG